MRHRPLPKLTPADWERFWSKADRSGGPSSCWTWTASRNRQGYGRFRINGRVVLAHRIAARSLPHELKALHSCDNCPCVNPSHLWAGTQAQNNQDRERKGRGNQPSGKRHGSQTKPHCTPRGTGSGMAKLNDASVKAIREKYATGSVTLKELAAEYNVGFSTIHSIVTRLTWAHV